MNRLASHTRSSTVAIKNIRAAKNMEMKHKIEDIRESIKRVIYSKESIKISENTLSKLCLSSQQKQCAAIANNEKVLSAIMKVNNINKKLNDIEMQLKEEINNIKRPEFKSPEFRHPLNFLEDLTDFLEGIPTEYHSVETAVDCLQGDAYSWALIFKERWSTIEDFKKDFLDHYWSQAEQSLVRREIVSGVYDSKSETMTQHFTSVVAQAKSLTRQVVEEDLVFDIMRHFSRRVQSKWDIEIHHMRARSNILSATYFLERMDKELPEKLKTTEIRPRVKKPRFFETTGNDGATVDITYSDEDDDDDYEEPKMCYNGERKVGTNVQSDK